MDSVRQNNVTPPLLASEEDEYSQVPRDSSRNILSPDDNVETQRQSEKVTADVLDWDGPDDPDNPMNWPSSKRIPHIVLIALIQLVSYVLNSQTHYLSYYLSLY